MRPQSLMNLALRCVRIFPGVNSRAELVTLAPGLRPERRFAPLARGQVFDDSILILLFNFVWLLNSLLNSPVPSSQ